MDVRQALLNDSEDGKLGVTWKTSKSGGISKSTLILLRSEKPSTYHRSAEAKPATSRSGG